MTRSRRFTVYVDPQRGNAVTIYRGLPYEPFGISLYNRHAASRVTLAEIPAARRQIVTDHQLRSLDDAKALISEIETGQLSP